MKTIVIAGSVSLQMEVEKWLRFWNEKEYEVLDYPRSISPANFKSEYPNIYRTFYKNLNDTDVLFIMNEDKNGITGYIGAETFAELGYVVAKNTQQEVKTTIYLAKMPSESVQCYSEIKFWLELGWIELLPESFN